jgi:phosphoribosylaminoimidazolecarboxamide formyltransferase/IMP cyclohydrolase
MKENGQVEIKEIDLVVFNFYPFSKMAGTVPLEKLRAKGIDIGGPAAVRSAAKAFTHAAVVTDPQSYEIFMEDFDHSGTTNLVTRFRLSQRAFAVVEEYDRQIAEYLATLDPQTVAQYYRNLRPEDMEREAK